MTKEIRLAACELRFRGSIEDLEGTSRLAAERLREFFPHPSEGEEGQLVLSSPAGDWTAWLTAESAGLETRNFRRFDEFREQLLALILAIDSRLSPGLAQIGFRLVRATPWEAAAFPAFLGQVLEQTRVLRGQIASFQYTLRESLDPGDAQISYSDVDVAAGQIGRHTVADRIEEAYEVARQLARLDPEGLAVAERAPIGFTVMRSIPMAPTTIVAYRELLPDGSPQGGDVVRELATRRAELLELKHFGSGLTAPEVTRLEALDRRLEELLPPVSAAELELLERMASRTAEIGERTRARRHRLGIT